MTVTVLSKSGLTTHGNRAKEAAAAYRGQISSAQRKIEAKVTGQQAEAINAFIAKLNSLSRTLHETYPQTLEFYSEGVLNYEADLSAAGFSSEVVKTKDSDIQSIKEWLGTTKSQEFHEKGENLNVAIKKASEALAMSPKPVYFNRDALQHVQLVSSQLNDLVEQRQTTHDDLEGSLKTFISRLDMVSDRLTGIKEILNNARFISSFDINTAMSLISRGYLTEHNMNYLDSVQEAGDGAALKIILSEPGYSTPKGFFTALGGIDTTNVSNPMMDIVYNRVNKEFGLVTDDDSVAMDHIRTFVYAIANQNREKSKIYFEKLVYAGDRYAGTVTTTARALVPELPDTGAGESAYQQYDEAWAAAHPQLVEFNDKLKRAGLLTTLFESLYAVGAGKAEKSYKHGGHSFTVDASTELKNLKYNHDGSFSFAIIEKTGINVSNKTQATTSFYNTSDEVENAKTLSELAELREKRKKAAATFALDLAKMASDKFIPGSSNILELISETMKVDPKLGSYLELADDQGGANFEKLYKKAVGDKLANTASIFSHLEEFGEIEEDLADNREKLGSSIFDVGGRQLAGSSRGDFVKYDLNYDLQANLKIDDLGKNGLRSYIYHETSGDIEAKREAVKQFETAMREDIASKDGINNPADEKEQRLLTRDAYQLFLDRGKKTVSDVKAEEIYQGLGKLQKGLREGKYFQRQDYINWDPFGLKVSDTEFGLGQ
ncbi:hypothetical protein [Streptococcus cristatus]|uniref:Uncharacterized protein n=1 Tax=Streptococcus cristatus TaxID=45634 RepID=A0A139N5G3_STRCR|nr:hypothetical protein [Streptococcus cristatus]KXT71152.1 hypothetical protein SCRDD08_00166 [Streptococcus cristatus]